MKLSTGLATGLNTYLAGTLTGGTIRLFTGDPPIDPDHEETGVLLGIATVSATPGAGLHFSVSGNAMEKADELWAFRALATGQAGWFRFVGAVDAGGASLSAPRIDGVIGGPGVPCDMNWDDTTVTAGTFYTLNSFLYLTQPV